MNVDEYQQQAASTAMYPEWAKVLYPVLGLIGEVGELVAKLHNELWPYGSPIPDGEEPYQDALLAMIGVGQRCETLKKAIRGGTDGLNRFQRKDFAEGIRNAVQEVRGQLENETADVEWYLSALVTDLNSRLSDVLTEGLAKLAARKAKGQIHNHKPDSQDHRE